MKKFPFIISQYNKTMLQLSCSFMSNKIDKTKLKFQIHGHILHALLAQRNSRNKKVYVNSTYSSDGGFTLLYKVYTYL